MKWKKLGLIFTPSGVHEKIKTHAANPLAILLENNNYRVFFSGRDEANRSSVGFVDIDIVKQKIVYEHRSPLFAHGGQESFYSHGVSIGNAYKVDGQCYILFMGWQIKDSEHWRGDIGQLVLIDNEKLELTNKNPFIGVSDVDPVSLSYPWVHREENGTYKMWYGSTITWDVGNKEMLHVINHAFSDDGINWEFKGLAIPFSIGTVQAFSRPTVLKNTTGYHMWFSYRGKPGKTYRIGYAYSVDGISWRLDIENSGIDVSDSGWDSEMIEYPFVIQHNGYIYMLYNGNGYGETGFGLAVLEGE